MQSGAIKVLDGSLEQRRYDRQQKPKAKILIVDDDKNVCKLLEMTFTDMGYGVVTASNGRDAVYQVHYCNPDLVISDVSMPGLDGYQLCHIIKSKRKTAHIPFIFVSARSDSSDVSLGLHIGADDYIKKPFDVKELSARVEILIRKNGSSGGRASSSMGESVLRDVSDPVHLERSDKRSDGEDGSPELASLLDMTSESDDENVVTEEDAIISDQESEIEECQKEKSAREIVVNENIYEESRSYITKVIRAVKAGKKFNLKRCMYIAEEMLCSLKHDNSLMTRVMNGNGGVSLETHSVNVAALSLAIGFGMRYPRENLVELGAAALLHDIGMSRLPESLMFKVDPHNRIELGEVANHPAYGAELIDSVDGDWKWLADVIHSEHERELGQGYPNGLKGDQIPEYARIIAAADIFEDLTHRRAYRHSITPHRALQAMINMRNDLLASKVIKALMEQITVYPLTTHVQLNTGEVGRVVAITSNLLRPIVKIVRDSSGRTVLEDKMISLIESPFIFISQAVADEELQS